ncbi:ribosomal protein L1 [Hyphopichia burtonii NRRL Y-1933]|uniref:Ribosomal protein L1 n=1 Tax=Hyphopichia burtonii NRRL Y-1933 TaxID=984485 RepID=A0A1E4RE46_9ASCO|nr:ribosomal protein L1 [Hyphopichia burtonii NRRL Y-1933]ODV65496.1 ribosomal protein L1 [Hyphopichia burtonii NRRL Y-1933]
MSEGKVSTGSSKFILGRSAEKTGKKSIQGLVNHIAKEKGSSHHEPIYIVINSKISYIKKKDYTPRVIPVTHKLDKLENKSILLITKDPSTPYRKALTEKDSPTEDVFNRIYTLTKVKLIAANPKNCVRLYKEYDIVVADHRVHKFLPNILGATFYEKNHKVPFMVQMARPSADANLVKGKKSTKLKDENCDPKYVRNQLKSIVGNVSFNPPANGTCATIKVGFSDWDTRHIMTNIHDVVDYLTNAKFAPVGGLLRSLDNIISAHLKTSESASLPFMEIKENKESDKEDYSDFDF